ncbi:hypothetical protein HYY69_08620 [Candidatus Woesearchaeota archaeon]|nr:hypothetical protein [Candidatus Woesearchaeota archaeon]
MSVLTRDINTNIGSGTLDNTVADTFNRLKAMARWNESREPKLLYSSSKTGTVVVLFQSAAAEFAATDDRAEYRWNFLKPHDGSYSGLGYPGPAQNYRFLVGSERGFTEYEVPHVRIKHSHVGAVRETGQAVIINGHLEYEFQVFPGGNNRPIYLGEPYSRRQPHLINRILIPKSDFKPYRAR